MTIIVHIPNGSPSAATIVVAAYLKWALDVGKPLTFTVSPMMKASVLKNLYGFWDFFTPQAQESPFAKALDFMRDRMELTSASLQTPKPNPMAVPKNQIWVNLP